MSESKYLIQGSTLTAIANALRIWGQFYDSIMPSQMTSYIQNKLFSQSHFDALISDPTLSSAQSIIDSSLLLNSSTSAKYMIAGSTLTSITNALREKGVFSEAITAAQIPSYIQNKIVSQGTINDFYNKTLSSIYNSTATTIGATAFQTCKNLHTVEFTECTTVGSSAFKDCTILSNLSMPKATTVNKDAFANCKSVVNLTIGLANISSNTVTGPMTYSNPNLKSVILPNCIAISQSTFQNCTNLTYISAPLVQALYSHTFQGCTALKEIELPLLGEDSNNYVIGTQAFQGCTALEKASFACVRGMNANAFSGCTSLKEFYAPCLSSNKDTPFKGVTTLEKVTVGYTTIPAIFSGQKNLTYFNNSKTTELAENALRECTALTQSDWNFGSNLSLIGKTAFMNCTGITELSTQNFPRGTSTNSSGITSNIGLTIGQQAFQGCTGISKVILNDISGVLSANAFSGCTGITEVSLTGTSHGTFTNLSTTPFQGCTSLKSLTLKDITTITTTGCCQSLPITDLLISNSELTSGTTITANKGFAQCPSLINIRGNFTSVGAYTFQSCTALETLNLDSLTSTQTGAFAECTSLTKVSLPNLINLSDYVFRGCTSLSEVYAPKATAHGTTPFGTITTITSLTTGHVTIPAWFANYPNLTYYSNSLATSTAAKAFYNCTQINETNIHTPLLANIAEDTFVNTGFVSITDDTFPQLSGTINHRVFSGCLSLEYVNLPRVTNLQQYVFQNCTKLSYLSVPAVTTVYTAYNQVPTTGCTALEFANFNAMTTIPYALFTSLAKLKSIYIEGATTLQNSAFKDCSALTDIYVNNLTTLGSQSIFENCTSLTEEGFHANNLISINNDDNFKNTGFTQLNSTTFPKLNYIRHRNFQSCSNLSSVSLPLVTYLGQYAFGQCTSLTYISVPAVTSIYNDYGYNAINGCTNLEFANFDGLPNIPYQLFNDRSKLTSVEINGASKIDAQAFQNCSALISIGISRVANIGNNAFINCTSLSNIYAPALTNMAYMSIFQNTGFRQLTSGMFPVLTSINHYNFQSCLSLSLVSLPLVTYLGASAFGQCTSLTYISVPAVTSIYTGNNLTFPLSGCTALQSANFNGMTTIPRYLFTNLENLKTVRIKAANTIQAQAFESCIALQSIELPNIKIIQQLAFKDCNKLSSIYILSSTLATLGHSNAFDGTQITNTTGSIFVPGTLLSSYQSAAQWSYFANRMYSMSQSFSLFGTAQTLTSDFMTWTEWDVLNNYNQAYTYKASSYNSYLYVPKYSKIQYGTSSYYWRQVGTVTLARGSVFLQKTSMPGTFMASSVAAYYVDSGYTYRYSYYQFGKSTDTIILGQNYNAASAVITSEMPTE